MPTTHALTKAHSNIWHLTTAQVQLWDSVIAPNQAEAALAVQHLLPPDGVWERHDDGRYTYHATRRSEVISHARHH